MTVKQQKEEGMAHINAALSGKRRLHGDDGRFIPPMDSRMPLVWRTTINRLFCGMVVATSSGIVAPTAAQKILTVPGRSRMNVVRLIAVGANQINIRAGAIRDRLIVAAIKKGSRKRWINVLVDKQTPELDSLIGAPGVHLRIFRATSQGHARDAKLAASYVMSIDKDDYLTWFGPRILTAQTFDRVTKYHDERGTGPGETDPMTVRSFARDFDVAEPLKSPSRAKHSRGYIRAHNSRL